MLTDWLACERRGNKRIEELRKESLWWTCIKPEKKAKWKWMLFVCSRCVQVFFFPSHESASESELKATRVTTWPLIQHRWAPMTGLNALLRLFSYREYWRCSSALLCVYGCYYNTGTTHKSPTLNLPPRVLWFIVNSFDHENKYNWNANKRADGRHMRTCPHTPVHRSTRTHVHTHTHTKIQLLFLREH